MDYERNDTQSTTRRRLLKATAASGTAALAFTTSGAASESNTDGIPIEGPEKDNLLADVVSTAQYRHMRSVVREDNYTLRPGQATGRRYETDHLPDQLTELAGDHLSIPCDGPRGDEDLTATLTAFYPAEGDGLEMRLTGYLSRTPIGSAYTDTEIIQSEKGHISSLEGGE